MRLTRWHVLILAIVAAIAIFATWPDKDALDYRTCEPRFGLSQLSASLYGRFFWEQALTHARNLAESAEKTNKEIREILDGASTSRDRKRQLLPPDERYAQSLRDQADSIEEQRALSTFTALHAQIISAARGCATTIAEKLQAM